VESSDSALRMSENTQVMIPFTKTFLLTLSLFFLLISSIYGQRAIELDRLDVFELNGKVYINCIISQGNTCDGIRYLRSTDGQNFHQIGIVTGICGSPDFPVGYEFVDKEPVVNETNYYKIEFGGYSPSRVFAVNVIDFGESAFKVVPQPVRDRVAIHFRNPHQREHRVKIFNSSGQFALMSNTQNNVFELDMSSMSPGHYVFQIVNLEGTSDPISGVIIVKN